MHSDSRYYRRGDLSHHRTLQHLSVRKRRHWCVECGRGFSRGALLAGHIAKEHKLRNEWIHKCEQCRERYPTLDEMRAHRRLYHLSESQYPLHCPKCLRRFFQARLLYEHFLESHISSEKWPYNCMSCEKRYVGKYACVQHERTHQVGFTVSQFSWTAPCFPRALCSRYPQDERGYVCGAILPQKLRCRACLRLIANNEDFDQHAQHHLTAEGRRSCCICDTKFAADKDLIKHFRTSHPRQRTFHCPHCAWGHMLKFSKLKYHAEKSKGSCSTLAVFNPLYSCDKCNHTWSTKTSKKLTCVNTVKAPQHLSPMQDAMRQWS
jgi:hypothetical protein